MAGIRKAFDNYAQASTGWARGRSCLLCNTADERASQDPGSARHVAAYFERLNTAFRHALINAQNAHDIDTNADLGELAAFLTTALIGVAASIRAQAPPQRRCGPPVTSPRGFLTPIAR